MPDVLIRVEGLHFTYNPGSEREVPALRGIDLEIHPGEYAAIVGANGSGKSTLARHLNALLLPTAGRVWVKGMDTRDHRHLRAIRQTVAMVFQNPENQIVATVVEEDVAFGPENLGVPEAELRARVEWAMEVTGITPLRARSPYHLSGGQKQRLALAGALAMRPELLVLDEATTMLDPAGRRAVREIVGRLHQQGMTVVAITQSMEEAAEASRVIALGGGKVALDGPPAQVFADEDALYGLGLDLPPVARLSRKLQARSPGFPLVLTPAAMVAALKQQALARGGAR